MNQRYFITGTDTGIGKTYVAKLLLQTAAERGLSALGLKPVAAGCEQHNGILANEDAWALLHLSTVKAEYADVNPVALNEAMAPHIAAAREHRNVQVAELAAHCSAMANKAQFTVIEGAGGWEVPLNETETMADLAAAINCPVILVVGMRLGCINHSLLTAAAIANSGLPLAGWVANCIDPAMPVLAENIAALEQRLPGPLLGTLPWQTAGTLNLDKLADRTRGPL